MSTIMNIITRFFVLLFIAIVCIDLSISQGDPTAKLTYKKIETKIFDNPYYDNWVGEIHPSGEKISLKIPVKKEIPPTMMMRGTIAFMGSEIGSLDMLVCESFKDELFAKSVADAGIPKGKFPQSCPIKSNDDYMIKDYVFPPNKIPPGLPDGSVEFDVQFYEPGKDPYVVVHADIELSHKIPGFGR